MEQAHFEPLGKGFAVSVTKTHHFSTDTILLADFSKPEGRRLCADLGTGCGTIPLIWLRDNAEAEADVVELQEDAVLLARQSVGRNGLGDRLRVHHADLRALRGVLPFGCYDLVSCNPPYKLSGTGIPNPDSARLVARHENECTLDDICAAAASLLQFGGRFCLCQRPERLTDAMEAMRAHNLEPKRLRLVQQRLGKEPKLFLLEGRRGGKRGFMQVLPTLFIENESGGFSDEMLQIYGSYKLNEE